MAISSAQHATSTLSDMWHADRSRSQQRHRHLQTAYESAWSLPRKLMRVDGPKLNAEYVPRSGPLQMGWPADGFHVRSVSRARCEMKLTFVRRLS